MTRNDLARQWGWRRIEAAADGSLNASDRHRMRRAMRADAALRAAVDRAIVLRRELRRRAAEPVPKGLRGRLLDVPNPAPRRTAGHRRHWLSIAAPATAAAAAVAVAAVLVLRPPASLPTPPATTTAVPQAGETPPAATTATDPEANRAEQRAVRQFHVAMGYVQQSAAATSDGVAREVADGMRQALAVGRSAVLSAEQEPVSQTQNGQTQNGD